MTYKDLVKRLSLVLDGDKMLIWSDGEGWSNLEIEVRGNDILFLPSKNNSPFSSDNQEEIEMKKKEIVTITRNEYEELLDYEEYLECLEAAGVDNWEGYDYAMGNE